MNREIPQEPPRAPVPEQCHDTLARALGIERFRLTDAAGVMMLEGEAPCYRMKKLAGVVAARLGARRLVNRLRVVPQSNRRDVELAEALRVAVGASPSLGTESIAVSVCDGIVTLQGGVSSRAVRCQAETSVWAVGGVVDVENQLRLKLPATRSERSVGLAAQREPRG